MRLFFSKTVNSLVSGFTVHHTGAIKHLEQHTSALTDSDIPTFFKSSSFNDTIRLNICQEDQEVEPIFLLEASKWNGLSNAVNILHYVSFIEAEISLFKTNGVCGTK